MTSSSHKTVQDAEAAFWKRLSSFDPRIGASNRPHNKHDGDVSKEDPPRGGRSTQEEKSREPPDTTLNLPLGSKLDLPAENAVKPPSDPSRDPRTISIIKGFEEKVQRLERELEEAQSECKSKGEAMEGIVTEVYHICGLVSESLAGPTTPAQMIEVIRDLEEKWKSCNSDSDTRDNASASIPVLGRLRSEWTQSLRQSIATAEGQDEKIQELEASIAAKDSQMSAMEATIAKQDQELRTMQRAFEAAEIAFEQEAVLEVARKKEEIHKTEEKMEDLADGLRRMANANIETKELVKKLQIENESLRLQQEDQRTEMSRKAKSTLSEMEERFAELQSTILSKDEELEAFRQDRAVTDRLLAKHGVNRHSASTSQSSKGTIVSVEEAAVEIQLLRDTVNHKDRQIDILRRDLDFHKTLLGEQQLDLERMKYLTEKTSKGILEVVPMDLPTPTHVASKPSRQSGCVAEDVSSRPSSVPQDHFASTHQTSPLSRKFAHHEMPEELRKLMPRGSESYSHPASYWPLPGVGSDVQDQRQQNPQDFHHDLQEKGLRDREQEYLKRQQLLEQRLKQLELQQQQRHLQNQPQPQPQSQPQPQPQPQPQQPHVQTQQQPRDVLEAPSPGVAHPSEDALESHLKITEDEITRLKQRMIEQDQIMSQLEAKYQEYKIGVSLPDQQPQQSQPQTQPQSQPQSQQHQQPEQIQHQQSQQSQQSQQHQQHQQHQYAEIVGAQPPLSNGLQVAPSDDQWSRGLQKMLEEEEAANKMSSIPPFPLSREVESGDNPFGMLPPAEAPRVTAARLSSTSLAPHYSVEPPTMVPPGVLHPQSIMVHPSVPSLHSQHPHQQPSVGPSLVHPPYESHVRRYMSASQQRPSLQAASWAPPQSLGVTAPTMTTNMDIHQQIALKKQQIDQQLDNLRVR